MSELEWWRRMEEMYADSPFHVALGLQLSVVDSGRVTVEYDGRELGRNRAGRVAGGALATMIDSAVCQAWRTLLDEKTRIVTIEMKVNFLSAGSPGERIITHGSLEHAGRRTAVGIGRACDANGRTLAIGLVTATKLA